MGLVGWCDTRAVCLIDTAEPAASSAEDASHVTHSSHAHVGARACMHTWCSAAPDWNMLHAAAMTAGIDDSMCLGKNLGGGSSGGSFGLG